MFEISDQKSCLDRSSLFCDSTLRPSDVKTASRLAHIGLAYHASWGVRVVYPRSGGASWEHEGLSTEVTLAVRHPITHDLNSVTCS